MTNVFYSKKEKLDRLKIAHDLISDPDKWIQGQYGRTADGEVRFGDAPKVCAWCSIGAIQYAAGDHEYGEALLKDCWDGAAQRAGMTISGLGLLDLNDSLDHEGIMKVWNKVIKQLESEQ